MRWKKRVAFHISNVCCVDRPGRQTAGRQESGSRQATGSRASRQGSRQAEKQTGTDKQTVYMRIQGQEEISSNQKHKTDESKTRLTERSDSQAQRQTEKEQKETTRRKQRGRHRNRNKTGHKRRTQKTAETKQRRGGRAGRTDDRPPVRSLYGKNQKELSCALFQTQASEQRRSDSVDDVIHAFIQRKSE